MNNSMMELNINKTEMLNGRFSMNWIKSLYRGISASAGGAVIGYVCGGWPGAAISVHVAAYPAQSSDPSRMNCI